MKDNIQYWCAVGTVKQVAFREDGTTYDHEVLSPVGEQHILYQGVLMCGKSREGIKKYRKANKVKTVKLRIENVPVCKECERKYKANSNLSWSAWVESALLSQTSKPNLTESTASLHGVKTLS